MRTGFNNLRLYVGSGVLHHGTQQGYPLYAKNLKALHELAAENGIPSSQFSPYRESRGETIADPCYLIDFNTRFALMGEGIAHCFAATDYRFRDLKEKLADELARHPELAEAQNYRLG